MPLVPANGQYVGPDSGPAGNTVAAATALPEDAPVVLEGYIVKQLYRKRCVFRDSTRASPATFGVPWRCTLGRCPSEYDPESPDTA